MNVYRNGSSVTLRIPFWDSLGNAVAPNVVSYRVYDDQGVEIVAPTAVPGFTIGDTEAVITVGTGSNQLDPGVARAARAVEITMTTADGAIVVNQDSYIIESTDTLEVMTNTFTPYLGAVMIGATVSGADAWNIASEHDRRAALTTAFHNIGSLTFQVAYGGAQNRLSGSVDVDNITSLSVSEWLALPVEFRQAIGRAQVIEANATLGGDPIGDKRRDGLMSETIGESSNMYLPSKALVLPVSADTMRALSRYVHFGKRLGRG